MCIFKIYTVTSYVIAKYKCAKFRSFDVSASFEDRILPFFKTLKNISNFEWISDCQKTFKELKVHLSSLKFFSQPKEGEDIFLYLRVSKSTVRVALVKEDKEIQCLVYFSSHTLHNVETRYLKVEKMALVLVNASRKLKLYV